LSKSGVTEINELLNEYSNDIESLEEKFKKIKILDPACGSGAFLIKAVEILWEIFVAIQDLKQSYGEYDTHRGLKRKSNIKGQLTFEKFEEKAEMKDIIKEDIIKITQTNELLRELKIDKENYRKVFLIKTRKRLLL